MESLNAWAVTGKDMTEVIHKAVRFQLDHPKPDAVLNIESHLFNVCLQADTCDYKLDVGKELWLNIGRWSRLCKEYVPREPLDRFVGQAVEILTGKARLGATANFMFRDPDRYAKKHRWGGCLMGATFRGDNRKSGPATLTFFSRTSYMGYMALLDAAIANRVANEIQLAYMTKPAIRKTGIIEPIAFRWYLSSMQLHCFKTLPYIFSQPDLFEKLETYAKWSKEKGKRKLPPTWHHTVVWYRKILSEWERWRFNETVMNTKKINADEFAAHNMLANEKYGPFKRIKRRWCEHMGYMSKAVPPSLPVKKLTFAKTV